MRIVAAGGADISISSPLQAAGADALTNSTSAIPTYDLLSGYNGATWDRLRALGDDSDGVSSASLGRLLALVRLSGFNGATWDRLLSEGNDRDAITNTTLGNLQTLGFQHVYNGATWDRATLLTDASDAVATDTSFGQGGVNRLTGFNGASYDRVRTLGGTSLDGLGQLSVSAAVPGSSVVAMVFQWVDPGLTRTTLLTPTSGKRLRIIGIEWEVMNTPTAGGAQIYFGTGAAIGTNPTSAISEFAAGASVYDNAFLGWPDGAGPVGAVDEVISYRHDTAALEGISIKVTYREE